MIFFLRLNELGLVWNRCGEMKVWSSQSYSQVVGKKEWSELAPGSVLWREVWLLWEEEKLQVPPLCDSQSLGDRFSTSPPPPTGPCLLLAQPNNSCCRLERNLYCQILLAKCVPCVPLTFTTAGKCLVINQNIKDEWSSLAVSCSHYHSEEMNVPSKISINQFKPALFSGSPDFVHSAKTCAKGNYILYVSVWGHAYPRAQICCGCADCRHRYMWICVQASTYVHWGVHTSVAGTVELAPGSVISEVHQWLQNPF